MLELDHLTVVAPSLDEGVAHLCACLDLDIPYGGTHPEMGTHNHRLGLGKAIYLEVIAIDPSAPRPRAARWFGLADPASVRADWDAGRRLRAWVARTDRIDRVLEHHGPLFGSKLRLSGGGRFFHFSSLPDGSLPLDGALPALIDRAGHSSPAGRLEDQGARLAAFTLEHPSPQEIATLYKQVGLRSHPRVSEGDALRYRAEIETPRGLKTLW
ncbi:VOC family protein [Algihabitans sp.]|uniref:VOC family protein n=1 Tax=Algihabitans sp. TaxID=2821514 RepID=UPI003BACE196